MCRHVETLNWYKQTYKFQILQTYDIKLQNSARQHAKYFAKVQKTLKKPWL